MITVADVMTANPITVSPTTNLGDVMRLMKANACRELPVMDGERLVGIITDRDVRLAVNSPLVLHERSQDQSLFNSVTAEDCMTPTPMVIEPGAPATHAADLLRTYKFGGLPVVDKGSLIGIVTISDILGSYIKILNSPPDI